MALTYITNGKIVLPDAVVCGKFLAFDGNHNLSFVERGHHGCAVNLQNRQPQRGDQNSECSYHHQRKHRASEHIAVMVFVFFTLQHGLQLSDLWNFLSFSHFFVFSFWGLPLAPPSAGNNNG